MDITFNGGAREVGGSCIVVATEDSKIALDYGIKIDEGVSNVLPSDLDAVVITHAHLDHSGHLFTLADKGIVIIGSQVTQDITHELLQDLIKIHRVKKTPFPYTFQDLCKISDSWLTKEHVAIPGSEIILHPAGHVLGANMVELKTEGKVLLYTGDFCIHDTEILKGINPESLPQRPDILIMESTYGGTVRPKRSELKKALFGKMIEAMEKGGNILIPAFAFHRLQEMTRRIDSALNEKILPRYNAYYISGLAHKISNYYNSYKNLLSKNVCYENSPFSFSWVKHLKRIEQIDEPAVVICTSGFGHAGASHNLLLQWAPYDKNAVIINTGYLPPDSPLLMAKEGRIISNGESIDVNADVSQIEFSGHADQDELIEFVKTLKPKKTFLVHGTLEQATTLSEKISEYTTVLIPEAKESFKV